MTRIRPTWTPPNTDNSSGERALGFDLQSDIAITANGAWWFQDGTAPPSTVRAMLWLTSGPTLVADSGTVSTAGYTMTAWNFVPFTSGFACAANTAYTVSVYSTGTYRYTSTDLASDIFDASGHVRALANTGRFANAAGPIFPTSIFPGGGMFGTDLDFTLISGVTPNGIALPITAGTPATAIPAASPAGLAVPLTLGQPIAGVLSGLTGNAHGPLPLAPGAVIVHNVSISGAVT